MTTIELLFAVILASATCCGIHIVTREGMIFGFVERVFAYLRDAEEWESLYDRAVVRLAVGVSKPLSECPPCMASIWGTMTLLVLETPLLWLVPAVLAVSFCNYAAMAFVDSL